jgi:peptidoglycan/LPS O-acetylase OafA/YrhL
MSVLTPSSPAVCRAPSLVRPKMPELDTIRGVAILTVLFYHGFGSRYGTQGLSGFPKLFVGLTMPGWAGVNLFFALSGFLITGILIDSKDHPHYYRRFYGRRALRILPAYYGLLMLLAAFGPYALQGQNISRPFLGLSFVYLANMTSLVGVPMQFGVLWSLAVEEHFYLLWPTMVRVLSRRVVGICAVLIAMAAAFARVVALWLGYDYLGHYTWLVADGLAFGALLAVLVRGPLGTRKGMTRVSILAFAIAIALILIDLPLNRALAGGALHITALNLACTGAVAAALLLGTSGWSFLVQRPVLAFFGNVSYGLYLIHMMIFNCFDALQHRFFPDVPSFKGHFAVMLVRFLVAGSLSVVVAALSRRYFEQPFLNLKNGLTSSCKGSASQCADIDEPSTMVQPVQQTA